MNEIASEVVIDPRRINAPLFAYYSISSTPIKAGSKAYTHNFERDQITWDKLFEITKRFSYSTMYFKGGHRLKDNVEGYGNIFIFDIDNDSGKGKHSYKAREVIEKVKGIKSLIVSTRSHTEAEHRLRLILLADKSANDNMSEELYIEVMHTIIEFCGLDAALLDKSCFSTDRQYAPNPNNQKHYYVEGELLPMQFIIQTAQKRLDDKAEQARQVIPLPIVHRASSTSSQELKSKRAYIKANWSFELMVQVLESKGLKVKDNGQVIVPGNKTEALSIDKSTGVLRDFANDTSYDPVSVLFDYYKEPLPVATNYIYELIGGQ